MTKPQNIIIQIKVVNGNKVFCWNNKCYTTEYLARLAALNASKYLSKSIVK